MSAENSISPDAMEVSFNSDGTESRGGTRPKREAVLFNGKTLPPKHPVPPEVLQESLTRAAIEAKGSGARRRIR